MPTTGATTSPRWGGAGATTPRPRRRAAWPSAATASCCGSSSTADEQDSGADEDEAGDARGAQVLAEHDDGADGHRGVARPEKDRERPRDLEVPERGEPGQKAGRVARRADEETRVGEQRAHGLAAAEP